MKALEKKLYFIISKQSEFAITLSSISDKVQILKNESKSGDSKIVILENKLEERKSRCNTIKAKLLEMEVKDRKINLIIHGLSKEKKQQTVFANVSTLFSSTMEITDNVQILQSYRISQKSNLSTRKLTAPSSFPLSILRNRYSMYFQINIEIEKEQGSGSARTCRPN